VYLYFVYDFIIIIIIILIGLLHILWDPLSMAGPLDFTTPSVFSSLSLPCLSRTEDRKEDKTDVKIGHAVSNSWISLDS